ncbi:MAG: orotidine-5'-phosphate decarboxylase [Rhodospirillales bacterium]|nr:MAG: orotidine-5'-phosphate decarboxylase [Rhodospirillales bacterium]
MAADGRNPILVAIDTPDPERARELAQRIAGSVGGIKLGLEFFNANGPAGVRDVAGGHGNLFLDLKFHDIPNTVAGAVRAALRLRPAILNVHAGGGPAMMRAAREAAAEEAVRLGIDPPLLVAVTVLTSLDEADLVATGQAGPVAEQVVRLANLARDCGLDGAVCSPQEIGPVREACGPDFTLVVPGIRPAGAVPSDQKRTMTPAEALAAGADWLVIGRPITGNPDPAAAASRIAAELAAP